jgi:hypothetical protein
MALPLHIGSSTRQSGRGQLHRIRCFRHPGGGAPKEAPMATVHRARAVLKIKRKNTVSVTGKANAMCSGIGGNPTLFVTPNPPISTLQAQIVVVGKAEVVAATKAKGAAAARNVQLGILVGMMETEQTYVQAVADTSPSPDHAVSTIQAAGLMVALVGQHTKAILTVKQGPQSGLVSLDAYAAALAGHGRRKTFFNWQSTVDGKTFVSLPSTPKSKTTVANLTPLTTYGFRVSVTNSDGIPGEWSQVVPFSFPTVELRAVA